MKKIILLSCFLISGVMKGSFLSGLFYLLDCVTVPAVNGQCAAGDFVRNRMGGSHMCEVCKLTPEGCCCLVTCCLGMYGLLAYLQAPEQGEINAAKKRRAELNERMRRAVLKDKEWCGPGFGLEEFMTKQDREDAKLLAHIGQ